MNTKHQSSNNPYLDTDDHFPFTSLKKEINAIIGIELSDDDFRRTTKILYTTAFNDVFKKCMQQKKDIDYEKISSQLSSLPTIISTQCTELISKSNINANINANIDTTIKINNINFQNSLSSYLNTHLSEIDKKLELMKKDLTATSQKRGKVGEVLVYNILLEHFPTLHLENISIGGDMIFDKNILIEVKNYTKTVDKKCITDLKTNLTNNNDMCIAVLISIGQSIACHGKLEIEKINNKYIIYVPNADKDLIICACLLATSFKTIITTTSIDNASDRIARLFKIINPMLERLAKEISIIKDNSNNLIKTTDNMWKNVLIDIKNLNDIII